METQSREPEMPYRERFGNTASIGCRKIEVNRDRQDEVVCIERNLSSSQGVIISEKVRAAYHAIRVRHVSEF